MVLFLNGKEKGSFIIEIFKSSVGFLLILKISVQIVTACF